MAYSVLNACRHIVLRTMLAALLLVGAVMPTAVVSPQVAFADAEHSEVAGSDSMGARKTLSLPGMIPITADQVREGTYDIEAECSSSFFKIVGAQLTVKDGEMWADITIRSTSYLLVYMGTGSQAAAAPASDYVSYNEETQTFTVPVSALDAEIDCSAFSKRRKRWYGYTLMFYAATLPREALLVDLPEYGEPEQNQGSVATTARQVASGAVSENDYDAVALDLPDGTYSIEVNMTGGSGRASVSSPTWLIVQDGRAYARLLWSSSYYDYMIVDEVKYLNETDDGGNSTFLIPITVMDEEMLVVADTTAMGDPVEIEYKLTFYSETIGDKDLIPQEAAIKVLEFAIVIIVVGGILNYFVKKRRKQ